MAAGIRIRAGRSHTRAAGIHTRAAGCRPIAALPTGSPEGRNQVVEAAEAPAEAAELGPGVPAGAGAEAKAGPGSRRTTTQHSRWGRPRWSSASQSTGRPARRGTPRRSRFSGSANHFASSLGQNGSRGHFVDGAWQLPGRTGRPVLPKRWRGRRSSAAGLCRLPREEPMPGVRDGQSHRPRCVGRYLGARAPTHRPAAPTGGSRVALRALAVSGWRPRRE